MLGLLSALKIIYGYVCGLGIWGLLEQELQVVVTWVLGTKFRPCEEQLALLKTVIAPALLRGTSK